MSKKKGKKKVIVNQAEEVKSVITDEEGFTVLQPTTSGKAKLDQVKVRRSKISDAANKIVEEAYADDNKDTFDLKPISKLLDTLEEFVKAGKYGKAYFTEKGDIIKDFCNFYDDMELYDIVNGDAKMATGIAKKLLSICKSYYEYDEKQRTIMSDSRYDHLLSVFKAYGGTEPNPIIPKGAKNLKKTDITYPTLHNNMNKAYRFAESDSIPEGVKEKDSVEGFLRRVMKAINATPETEFAIECSPKIDGVSVNGTVHDDMLINPQTRGDTDASVAVMGMSGLQIASDFKAETDFGIQYEAFVTKEDKDKAAEYLGLNQPYVSCRHAAAGITHRLSTMEDDDLLQYLSLYPIASEGLEGTYEERIDYIQNFGIVPKDMPKRKVFTGNFNKLMKKIEGYFEDMEDIRDDLSFAIDGIVLTVVDDNSQSVLGRDGRTNKFQIALKFDPASAIATVRGITLDSGKKGYRTVQVQLNHPVYIDGVRYDHVPVLSAGIFNELNLREGTQVNVHRSGDVIPEISVVEEGNGKKIKLPDTCPCCGKRLVIRNKKLYCQNPECIDNIVGRFVHLFEQLGMDGYADSICTTLVKDLKCNTVQRIFQITDRSFEVHGVTKTAALEQLPKKLKDAVSKKKDYEVLGAIGLPGVGPQKAKILIKNLPNHKIGSDIHAYTTPELRAACIAAVGEDQADELYESMSNYLFAINWAELYPYIGKFTTDFSKKTRVGHTGGDLSAETEKLIEDLGYELVDGKSFDILITRSMGSSSGKMEAAKKRNNPIFLEDDFVKQYKDKVA
jgi:NAD-dependent DNA ligase